MTASEFGKFSRRATLVLIAALLGCSHVAWATITVETVPIGDVGNPNDPTTGNLYGGVSYEYRIGKYEVTADQYTAFLNAVAATDTYGLYTNGGVVDTYGIARYGTSGSYSYSVIGSPNNPVVVYWGSAARFANWLHNGQPTGAQNASTTEDGAYSLNGATSSAALNAATRNIGATWFIPTENEWYKAAYYQSAAQGGDNDSYWNYPMRTNTAPYSDQPPGATPDNTRVGNFYKDDGLANGYDDGYAVTGPNFCSPFQDCRTVVGAYGLSPSYYGTFDQGGDVAEWNESLIITEGGSIRDSRGGSWHDGEYLLRASVRFIPTVAPRPTGFRVATVVPEPVTAILGIVGSVLICSVRKRRLPTL